MTVLHNGRFSYLHHSQTAGVSPCLNVKLSSILYTSQVATNTYKLTVKDDSIKINAGDARDNFTEFTVPYTITGDFSRLSFLLTNAEWTDSGWSNADAEFIYLEGDRTVDSKTEHSETGVCGFGSRILEDHPDYNVYLIAEKRNGDHETDFASAPVKLAVKRDIAAIRSGYTGTYDDKPHGISIDVFQPSSGATVKYGTAEGTYDLNASPTITNVADGPLTVYYQITADDYFTTTGHETVTILPANPEIPTGVTAYYGKPLSNASLPDGWSWDNDTSSVGNLGTKTFSASYNSTNPNYKPMNGVTIPVTVVEREHNWGDTSYEWSFDNSSVTAKHTCSVCGIEEIETVSTSSAISVPPTCSAKGETTYTATFKNRGFETQTKTAADVPANHDAHSWGAWTVTKAATKTEEGVEQRTCMDNASHVETRAIPKLDSAKPDTSAKEANPDTPAKKANPLKVAAKKTIKAKATKTTKIKKAITVKAAQGKVTAKTNNKKVKVDVGSSMKKARRKSKEEKAEERARFKDILSIVKKHDLKQGLTPEMTVDMVQKGHVKIGMQLSTTNQMSKDIRAAAGLVALALVAMGLVIGACILGASASAVSLGGVPLFGGLGLVVGVALAIYVFVKIRPFLK